jgi:hypothetical protein
MCTYVIKIYIAVNQKNMPINSQHQLTTNEQTGIKCYILTITRLQKINRLERVFYVRNNTKKKRYVLPTQC